MGRDIAKILAAMRRNPSGIRFTDALAVAQHYFGEHRTRGSHHIFRTPWASIPGINLQEDNGRAKPYQVRQLLAAIDRLERQ